MPKKQAQSAVNAKSKTNLLDAEEVQDSGDDWLISFVDVALFLLGFFVILYSMSELNKDKSSVVSKSIGEAMGNAPDEAALIQNVTAATDYRDILFEIQKYLSESGLTGQTTSRFTARGIELTAQGELFFSSGNSDIRASAKKFIRDIASFIKEKSFAIEIQGHTDNRPISTARFPSNWDLSTSRASRVVRLLIDYGVAPKRLSAIGYADTQPLQPPTQVVFTAAERAKNRRVVFVFSRSMGSKQQIQRAKQKEPTPPNASPE